MAVTDAPTNEIGTPGLVTPANIGAYGRGRGAGMFTVEALEDTPELVFPQSAAVFDRMRKTDGQHTAVLRAAVLPLMRTPWRLVGEDVDPRVMQFVETELGLTDRTGRQRRRRQGVVWTDHLRQALLMLPFGFMPFEIVYEVDAPSPGQEDVGMPLVAHLRKLAPRLPRTLTEAPRVSRDGGLAGIVQAAPHKLERRLTIGPGGTLPGEVFIPVDRLCMYVNDREGADWTGTSMFRGSYANWLIKDALLRLGPMICERNGMGVPVVYFQDEGHRQQAMEIARNLRAGSEAGIALPDGMRMEIQGVAGTTRDELPLVEYHDRASGRASLAMFLNLGHDNGARSLGETFVDYFVMSLDAIADNIAETATEHIIRDLVEINFGPDEAYPVLEADSIAAEATPTADALRTLADGGLLGEIDPDLTTEIRRRYGLPKQTGVLDAQEQADLLPGTPPPLGEEADQGDQIVDRLAKLAERVAALRAAS